MSSLRLYICFSQRSFIIDFNGARPIYPKLNSELGICIHYRLIRQFKSIIVHKKHRQYHSTTRLIGTSLAHYDGFLYHFTSASASAEICMSQTSLISLILSILFSAVTTAELATSKLKACFFFCLFFPFCFIHSFNLLIYTYFTALFKFVSVVSLQHTVLNSVKPDCSFICSKAFHIMHVVFYFTVWRTFYEISSQTEGNHLHTWLHTPGIP